MHDPYALKMYIEGSAYRNPGHEEDWQGLLSFRTTSIENLKSSLKRVTTELPITEWSCGRALARSSTYVKTQSL